MSSIYLYAKDRNSTYKKSSSVTEHSFKGHNLFVFYEHKHDNPLDDNHVYLYKDKDSYYYYVKLCKNQGYEMRPFYDEKVYFNIYEKSTPLLTLFNFGASLSEKYYTNSRFETDSKKSWEIMVSNLPSADPLKNEKELLKLLLEENDKMNNTITYRIEKIKGTKDPSTYCAGKIIFSAKEEVKIKGADVESGFYCCKHYPKREYASFSSFFLYQDQVLMTKGQDDKFGPIDEIQNTKYNATVYYGSRVTEPLFLELNSGGSGYNTQNKYYYHSKDENYQLFWKKLDISNYEKITENKSIHNNNLYMNLTHNNNENLVKFLDGIESKLIKKFVLLLEKIKTYSNSDIDETISKNDMEYRRIKTFNVIVSNKSDTERKCLSNGSFRAYNHNFNNSVRSITSTEEVELLLFLPSDEGPGYKEIKLSQIKDTNKGDEGVKLFCKKSLGKTNMYAYFHGSDPRPLLFEFDEIAYKPASKKEYCSRWVKIEKTIDYECTKESSQFNKTLRTISNYLNPVEINQTLNSDETSGSYDIQTFGTTKISITISRRVWKCYISFTHESKEGFRLGSVIHKTNYSNFILNPGKDKEITRVITYFFKGDTKYRHPLFVVIELKDYSESFQSKEYHELTSGEFNLKWEKSNDLEGLNGYEYESKLLKKLNALNKKFNKNLNTLELECGEEGKKATTIGIAVGSTMTFLIFFLIGFSIFSYRNVFITHLPRFRRF